MKIAVTSTALNATARDHRGSTRQNATRSDRCELGGAKHHGARVLRSRQGKTPRPPRGGGRQRLPRRAPVAATRASRARTMRISGAARSWMSRHGDCLSASRGWAGSQYTTRCPRRFRMTQFMTASSADEQPERHMHSSFARMLGALPLAAAPALHFWSLWASMKTPARQRYQSASIPAAGAAARTGSPRTGAAAGSASGASAPATAT